MTHSRIRISLIPLLLALFAIATSCGTEPVPTDASPAEITSAQATREADPFADLDVPAAYAARPKGAMVTEDRGDETLEIEQPDPSTRDVGAKFDISGFVTVDDEFWDLKIERVISGSLDNRHFANAFDTYHSNYGPGDDMNRRQVWAGADVVCTRVGIGSFTVKTMLQVNDENGRSVGGQSTLTLQVTVNCVEDRDPPPFTDAPDRTSLELGFSQDSLTWVAFEQEGIVLRVNQIDPVRLEVGESVEIYADFDALSTLDGDSDKELKDARIELTAGGPVKVDSSPGRQFYETAGGGLLEGSSTVVWGFRSGTLTCTAEGEGVYMANLTGTQQGGGTISQIVSGLVDCEAKPVEVVQPEIPYTGVVYTIDGRPYERAQFQLDRGHDGCAGTHIHSESTVYPYEEWFIRGNIGALQSTGNVPLTDPDPQGYGFGDPIRFGPGSVLVPNAIFVKFCDRVEEFVDKEYLPGNCDAIREILK